MMVLLVRGCSLLCAAHALSSTGGWVRRVVRVGESLQIEVQERAQSDRDHLGGLTWTGGRALAEYLAARPELVEGRRVLELGCGSALVSLTCRELGAAATSATDVDGLDRVDAAVSPAFFDVCSEAALPPCDVMVAADVMYTSDLARALARRAAEAHRGGARVVVADSQGWASNAFREALDDLLVGRFVFESTTVSEEVSGRERRKRVRILSVPPPDGGEAMEGS